MTNDYKTFIDRYNSTYTIMCYFHNIVNTQPDNLLVHRSTCSNIVTLCIFSNYYHVIIICVGVRCLVFSFSCKNKKKYLIKCNTNAQHINCFIKMDYVVKAKTKQ